MSELNDLQDRRVLAEQLFGRGEALEEIEKLIAENETEDEDSE